MRVYADKTELIEEINKVYKKYIEEFNEIPETLKDKRVEEVDKTPSENLSYQLGWLDLLLGWERMEQQGLTVHTPAEGYGWNKLGGLYQSFYKEYGSMTLSEQRQLLDGRVADVLTWVDGLSEQELFEPGQRKWATTNAQWPLCRWIHINTVAPFTSFRTKIRKWKKIALA